MEWTLVAALAGLALVDSTSIGTLLIPLWMLLEPKLRVPQFFVYLATVAGFYFVVGLILITGAGSLRGLLDGHDVVGWVQLVVGAALFLLSFYFEPKRVRRRRARRGGTDPATRWRARLSTAEASPRAMAGRGVAAAGIEVLSMVPYLAAIGLLTAADVGAPLRVALLTGYVVVMVLPALVLLGVRTALGSRIDRPLQLVSAWMSRHLDGALGWVLAIIGVLLVRDAVLRLHLIG
ncbi:GAP family protein [Actinoplanes sp. NPDC048791]|uniref:GAP family protein n=1 Tax=Actinoplanes sp. NPDC048791 TaxID=3154623 RepID=UPI003404C152